MLLGIRIPAPTTMLMNTGRRTYEQIQQEIASQVGSLVINPRNGAWTMDRPSQWRLAVFPKVSEHFANAEDENESQAGT